MLEQATGKLFLQIPSLLLAAFAVVRNLCQSGDE